MIQLELRKYFLRIKISYTFLLDRFPNYSHPQLKPFFFFFFVVWQGIYDPGQTQEKSGNLGFILLHPYLLCCLDQVVAVMELSQHLVSSSKTVRPIIPWGARCTEDVKIMLSEVCLLAPHSHFAEEARPHLRIDEPKRPTPGRRRLSLTQAVLVKLIPIGLVLTLVM